MALTRRDPPRRQQPSSIFRNPNFQGLLVLALVVAIGVAVVTQNRQPARRVALPGISSPTASNEPGWRAALGTEVNDIHTLTPTVATATTEFIPPTAAINFNLTPQIIQVTQIQANIVPTIEPQQLDSQVATIEFRGPTPIPSPTGFVPGAFNEDAVAAFQPPAAEPPLSLQPNDHFLFRRPVYASANSRSIFYYPYGGRWPGNETTVHHGVDMPNPIGELVLAGWDGKVIWAGRSEQDTRVGDTEIYAAYGNFVIIEHDFTWQGQPVWTLYAHLSAILVEQGARVEMGDRIGLVGVTGLVTGAHVHFEVRIATNNYAHTYNPLLWIAPYVGHGVVAGRVVDAADNYISDANLTLYQGGQVVDRTTSYATNTFGGRTFLNVNPDPNWQENFAFGDVPAGQYQLVVVVGGRRMQRAVTVNPEMVNFVVFEVNPPESTPIPDDGSSGNPGS